MLHTHAHASMFMIRYSEFDDLRQRLESAFPHARNALPALPPKSVLCALSQAIARKKQCLGTLQSSTQKPTERVD